MSKSVLQKITKRVLAILPYVLTFAFIYASTALPAMAGGPGAAGGPPALDFGINETNFLDRIFQIAFGIGVGSGVILIGSGGLKIASAMGNPEAIQEGRDQITSAMVGLGVVVFSVVILEILGVDLLGLGSGFYNAI